MVLVPLKTSSKSRQISPTGKNPITKSGIYLKKGTALEYRTLKQLDEFETRFSIHNQI